MKFDWYQASVPDVNPNLIMQAVSESDYYGQWVESKCLKGYDTGAQFVVGDQVKFRINYGGHNAEHGANIAGTGQNAPLLASILRREFAKHRVSRADVAEDFHHPDAYNYLRKQALKIAALHKVKVREITKPIAASDDGCTLYAGAPTSSISTRLYEKGKQLGLNADWVRNECQVRPQKAGKDIAALLEPEQFWALSPWTLAIAHGMGKSDLARVNATIYDQADEDKAYAFCIKQYGRILSNRAKIHGSWETLGAQMGYDIEHAKEKPPRAVLEPLKR